MRGFDRFLLPLFGLALLGCGEEQGGAEPADLAAADQGGTANPKPAPPRWQTTAWPGPRGGVSLPGRVPDAVPRSPEVAWTFTADAGIVGPAAIVDGVVYVGSVYGTIFALDAETGEKKWSFEAEDTIEAAPTVSGGTVYVGSNYGTLHALDAATGEERWKKTIPDKVSSAVNIVPAPDGSGEWILMNGYDGIARCLRAEDGSEVWTFKTEEFVNGSPAVVDGKYVVFGGCDAVIYTLNLADGTAVNRVRTEAYITASVATFGQEIYVGNHGNQVLAVNALEEDLSWVYEDSEFPFFASPAVTETTVFIGGRDKDLHAIDRKTGEGLWKVKTGGRLDSSPIAFADAVVFGSSDGRLYALNPSDGSEEWVLDLGEGITADPAFASGLIVVGGSSETVFGIRGE